MRQVSLRVVDLEGLDLSNSLLGDVNKRRRQFSHLFLLFCLFDHIYERSLNWMQPSTGDEREKLHIRMHTGKQLELLCLDQQDGSLLGSIGFQVNHCFTLERDHISTVELSY